MWYATRRALVLVNAQHFTASAFINDDESGLHHDYESGLHHDYEEWLERLAPHAPIDQYWHNRTGGRLDLGTWERIFSGQAEWLARESRRAAAEAGVGQDHRR